MLMGGSSSLTQQPCECENPQRGVYKGRDGDYHCEQCDGLIHACEGGCGELVGGPIEEFPYCARCLAARFRAL